STSSGGIAIPVPARTARAWVIRAVSPKKRATKKRSRGRIHPGAQARVLPRDVKDGEITFFDEPVAQIGPLAVEPFRRGRRVQPDLQRRSVGLRRDVEVGLPGRTIQDIERAAVGAPAAVAGLAELVIGLQDPLVERLAKRIRLARRRIALVPEAVDEGG